MEQRLIPVIHIKNEEQTLKNVEACIGCGINSAFLINHNGNTSRLLEVGNAVHKRFPIFKLGYNFLGLSPMDTLPYLPNYLEYLWSDSNLVYYSLSEQKEFNDELLSNGIRFFGGVAFKYQPQPSDDNFDYEIRKAAACTDIICTSGDATGVAAPISKLQRIRNVIGVSKKLAVASGVTAENVKGYKHIVDYFMVASSITDNKELIIPDKLKELKNVIYS